MSFKTLGCLKCGSSYDVIPPDGVYTEPRSKLDDPPGDFVEMKNVFPARIKIQFIGTSPKLNNNFFRIFSFKL